MKIDQMIFEVPGEPTGKSRPRVTKFGNYTPEKTVLYENLIKTYFMIAKGRKRNGHIYMGIKAYFKIPKSATKQDKGLMRIRAIRPTKKPDADNILKIVADALNNIAYDDDSQIVSAKVEKFYADDDDNTPKLIIDIREIR